MQITSAGDGNSDTMDGGSGSDTLNLQLDPIFFDNNKLKNIETIEANAIGSLVTLTGQTENFTITGELELIPLQVAPIQ